LDQSGNITFAAIEHSLSSCPQASTVLDYQTQYQDSMDAYLKLINPVPDTAIDLHDLLEEWGNEKMTLIIWIIYSISILVTVLVLVSQCFQKHYVLYVSVVVSCPVLLGMLVAWCLFLIGLVSKFFV
jgi:hypothetical protein